MILPHNLESEMTVLGACLDHNAYESSAEILKPEMFYNTAHKTIYEVMADMYRNMIGVDVITLKDRLTSKGVFDQVGGLLYLMKLSNAVKGVIQLKANCDIIKDRYIKREIIKAGNELVKAGYDMESDCFDTIATAETNVYSLTQNFFKSDYVHISDVVPEMVKQISIAEQKQTDVTGIDIGYYEMNRVISGWQPTDLIIIAARPSVGKTAFGLNIARNAVRSSTAKCNVGFFSLEMSNVQLVKRLAAMDGKHRLNEVKTGKNLNKVTFTETSNRISNYGIYIDDTAGLNIFELRSKVKRMVTKHQVGMVVIDYLQLMSGLREKNGNREQEISSISRDLKKLGKELSIPIIALCQLSREVEKRADKRPVLSDLRESGAIEQDADIVIFLSRPSLKEREENPDMKTVAMVDIAKHRNGELMYLQFDSLDEYQIWEEKGKVGSVSTIPDGKYQDEIPF